MGLCHFGPAIEKAVLSRDRFGKKPLYYTRQKGLFAFASELEALVRHRTVESRICDKNLRKYFAYGYIPAPGSILKNVYKLPGGYNLIVDVEGLSPKVEKYWEFILDSVDCVPHDPESVWGEELRHLISKAVHRRMAADVSLGIFLSGGIDSSSVAAFACQHRERATVNTFSIGFEEKSFDESHFAQTAACFLGTEHHSESLALGRAKRLLPDVISHLDEPMGDSSLLPTRLPESTLPWRWVATGPMNCLPAMIPSWPCAWASGIIN